MSLVKEDLQSQLDRQADAELKAEIEAALPLIKAPLNKWSDTGLRVKADLGGSMQANVAIEHIRKAVFKSNQPDRRKKFTAEFIEKVNSLQTQVDELAFEGGWR